MERYIFNTAGLVMVIAVCCLTGCSGCSNSSGDSDPTDIPDNVDYPTLPGDELKVMTFNIWMGGGNSIDATRDVLSGSGADIVGVQESTRDGANTAVSLADRLGWYSYAFGSSRSIISRYPVVDTTANRYGVKIRLDEKRFVWMFNVHLMYCPYEPYQLSGIKYCGAGLLSTAAEAVDSALKTRGEEVALVVSDIEEVQGQGWPIFLTGDFNEPSYLDWTQKAADAGLCKMAVPWPSVKTFMEEAEMLDSYRVSHPDEVTSPGHTWTTLPATDYAEVLDRIDFVLFHGGVEVLDSSIVGEKSTLSDIGFENYPSDHRSVVSTFRIKR